jgi:hypothetical protein
MPFTFSHPAVVLPLNRLSKRWISLTALVIGSLTPDFEYFIRMKVYSTYSHNWIGLFWFDLPLGLLLLMIYNYLVKNKLIDHLPTYFNKRFSQFKNPDRQYLGRNFLIILLCLLIGAASHILWDSFTHPTGYFVTHHHFLSHKIIVQHFPIPVYNILQHLSTLIGIIIILYAINQLPPREATKVKQIVPYWIKVAVIGALILLIRLLTGLKLHDYGDVIMSGISGLLIGLIIVSVITPDKQSA